MARTKLPNPVTDEKAHDLAYIKDPMRWVTMLCPVKKMRTDRSWYDFAYMTGDGPNLYHGNMFNPRKEDRKEEFVSYEAIIEAGWVVD